MSDIKACLFDLDGVLVDTARYHYIAWRELAEELGFVFTEQDNERLKGVSRAASLNILLEIGGITLGEDEKARLAEQKNNRYVEYIAKMDSSEILPGALDFLQECRTSRHQGSPRLRQQERDDHPEQYRPDPILRCHHRRHAYQRGQA